MELSGLLTVQALCVFSWKPAIRPCVTGHVIPCFDSCQLITTLMCNQFPPGLPKKLVSCESKYWFSCGADERSAVGRCTVTWLPNFLAWVDLLSYGAPPTRARSALVELRYDYMTFLVAIVSPEWIKLYSYFHKSWSPQAYELITVLQ